MKKTSKPIDPDVEKVCEAVISAALLGIHHVPYWERRRACGPRGMAVTTYADMSTFDGDELTRLVIAAHDHAVRVSVCPAGPRMLTIRMWPRKREGGTWERHPEIEEAVERVRKWTRFAPAPKEPR